MSYYKKHVFFCINQRENGVACCAQCGAAELQAYAKEKIKGLKKNGPGKIRVNRAGCLDRCDEGPVMVVYPEAVWYRYFDQHDIDEIIDSHLLHDRHVERLKI
ncbi:MAG: (2Fe-2S) ferredoxin domain-containing protein [Betaproteobacteria bacterium]|jgi:(2Fe-2S) ferredoxin|nr:(2Fe-2S) ferredoxin domain-containing protein [Betaproteobacteria bacterium]